MLFLFHVSFLHTFHYKLLICRLLATTFLAALTLFSLVVELILHIQLVRLSQSRVFQVPDKVLVR